MNTSASLTKKNNAINNAVFALFFVMFFFGVLIISGPGVWGAIS